jgi:hypothetical protein
MKAIDLISALRQELATLKTQGQTAVPVAGLEAYLAAVEPEAREHGDAQATAQALAKGSHELEVWKLHASLQHASDLEMFKSVIAAGQAAMRAVMTINGGAAVALLAFLGNVVTRDATGGPRFSVPCIRTAMATFVFGVGFAGAAMGATYFVQELGARKLAVGAERANYLAIALGAASLVAFFRGALWSYWAFG